jgi:replicative DNA helicase
MQHTPAPSTDAPSHIDMVRCAAAQLDLAQADDAMQRVAAQWARLQAMASVLSEEPLGIADEPAPIFTP